MSEKKRAVGFAVLTVSEAGEKLILLQRRGELNEKKMSQESFAGACQLTMHGDLELAEHPRFCLLREMQEELGPEAAKWIADRYSDDESFLQKADEAEGPTRQVITFAVRLDRETFWEQFFPRIRLHNESGGLALATKAEIEAAKELLPEHKASGVPDRGIYMFPDEKQTALKAFDVLSR